MGCQIAQNLCAITTPCTPFWLVHRYWGIILGLPCLPFATSLHNNPALSQCLHVAVLCHSEENHTAFQTHLKDNELSQTLQYTFKIYIYIYLYIYRYMCIYIYFCLNELSLSQPTAFIFLFLSLVPEREG